MADTALRGGWITDLPFINQFCPQMVAEGETMISRAYTVAFEGIEARLVEVQCAVSPGMPAFSIGGLIKLRPAHRAPVTI